MRKSKFSENQIIQALKEAENGKPVLEVCRSLGINHNTFYTWRKKYGCMEVSHLRKLKELEEENKKLKFLYADAMLDNRLLKEIVEKKL